MIKHKVHVKQGVYGRLIEGASTQFPAYYSDDNGHHKESEILTCCRSNKAGKEMQHAKFLQQSEVDIFDVPAKILLCLNCESYFICIFTCNKGITRCPWCGSEAEVDLKEEIQMINMDRILKAQEENRLLVMPCDMGDRIYIVQTSHRKYCTAVFIRPSRLSPFNVYRVCREYGKNVFLTMKEAEEAKIRIEREINLKIDVDAEGEQA